MENGLFSGISCDYYVRHYELNYELFGFKGTIFAECAPNLEGLNGHHYYLGLSFSVGDIGAQDFLIGVTFGNGPMSKDQLDGEIDSWVSQMVSESTFQNQVAMYLKKEQVWDEFLTNEMTNDDNP